MKKITPLMFALRAAKERNDGAYFIIGITSGFGESRVKAIAEGAKASFIEEHILVSLAVAK
jgi:hypothetical protein